MPLLKSRPKGESDHTTCVIIDATRTTPTTSRRASGEGQRRTASTVARKTAAMTIAE
jgi:hypothetical protein